MDEVWHNLCRDRAIKRLKMLIANCVHVYGHASVGLPLQYLDLHVESSHLMILHFSIEVIEVEIYLKEVSFLYCQWHFTIKEANFALNDLSLIFQFNPKCSSQVQLNTIPTKEYPSYSIAQTEQVWYV
jgi:hypothetical protein